MGWVCGPWRAHSWVHGWVGSGPQPSDLTFTEYRLPVFEVDLTQHSHETFEGGLTSLRALSHLQDVPHPWLPGNQVGDGEGRVGEGGHRRASELMQGSTLPHSPGPAPNAGSAWLGLGHLGPKPGARFQEP